MICKTCKIEFIPTPSQERGRMGMCTPCLASYHRAYRQRRKDQGNPLKVYPQGIEYQREYAIAYYKRSDVRKRRNEQQKSYKNREDLRHKYHARQITIRAVRSGILSKMPCEVCGELKVDAHHDDYSKPLDIRWLCRTHHSQHHKQFKHKKKVQG